MGERFGVRYRIFAATQQEAEVRAEGIALEQTVEIPRDCVPPGYIEDTILGQVISVVPESEGAYFAEITYSMDAVGNGFTQLLNVIFGNSSIQMGIKLVGFTPCAALTEQFPGAGFGAKGIRALTGRKTGGFVCPVIKPMGSSSERLAELAYLSARAGADIIKEDHGLANQPLAPFVERVVAIEKAVSRANMERAEEGDTTRALYFANLCPGAFDLRNKAMFAQEAGADGVIIMPGISGFDAINALTRDPDFALPIMAHPSHLGPFVLSPETGYSHAMMFGTLMRLAGADISVFPNVGGRFGFSLGECASIASACGEPGGYGVEILPSPGGGMSVQRMAEMVEIYGDDCVYLLGGALLRYGDRIGDGIREMRVALSGKFT